MMEWISVDKKLPEKTDVYLTAFDNKGQWLSSFNNGKWRVYEADEINDGLIITHWMPLPDLPK